MMPLAVRLVIICALSSGCVSPGLNRDEAAELAVDAAGSGSTVVSVELGRLSDFVDRRNLPGFGGDRGVWAVVVTGEFPGECVVTATGDSRCPPVADSALVVLDHQTGELLLLVAPSP